MANLDPQNLNYFIMAAEGLLKSLIPPTSQKSPKSLQNGSHLGTKRHPRGPKGPKRDSKTAPKKATEKDIQKDTQKKPVLAREREARLKEERCRNVCSTSSELANKTNKAEHRKITHV